MMTCIADLHVNEAGDDISPMATATKGFERPRSVRMRCARIMGEKDDEEIVRGMLGDGREALPPEVIRAFLCRTETPDLCREVCAYSCRSPLTSEVADDPDDERQRRRCDDHGLRHSRGEVLLM